MTEHDDEHRLPHEPETTGDAPISDDPGLVAGRYRILRTLGRGGGGHVWLAEDDKLGRQVALKRVGGEADAEVLVTRGLREARTSATLAHEHVVRVYDAFEFEGAPWIVMEYVPGPSLAALLEGDRRLEPAQVALIGAQVATALAAAHGAGIVHRDVKPANVLLSDASGRNAKLTDFGIARAEEDTQLTRTGFVAGTASYFSPELASGKDPSPAADVWALGATLYAAVEGRRPFREEPNAVAQLHTIAREEPAPPTRAGALVPVLQGMLETDPERRWDAAHAAEELRRIATSPGSAEPSPTTQAVPVADPTRSIPLAHERQPGPWPDGRTHRAPAPAPTPGPARPAARRATTYQRPRPSRRPPVRRSAWLGWLLAVPLLVALGWLVWTIVDSLDGTGSSTTSGTEVDVGEAEQLAQEFYARLQDDGLASARELTTEGAYIADDLTDGLDGIELAGLSGQPRPDGSATVTARATYTYGGTVIVQDEQLTIAPVDGQLRITERFANIVSGGRGGAEEQDGQDPQDGQDEQDEQDRQDGRDDDGAVNS